MPTVQQLPGIARTNLQEHDLSIIPEREVVQTRVDVSPGARYVWHKHPDEEVIYVLEGLLEYQIDGESTAGVQRRRGIARPAEHGSRGEERRHAAEFAMYVVEKGNPLVAVVD